MHTLKTLKVPYVILRHRLIVHREVTQARLAMNSQQFAHFAPCQIQKLVAR
jgi:hypothetical protein